jgi:hypothetical protein
MSNVTKEEFDRFMDSYLLHKNKLCIKPKTGEQTQNIFQFFAKNFHDAKVINETFNIIYLYKEDYEIVAFALVDKYKGYTTLVLLCTTTDKTLRKNGKSLGIYLLDTIYSDYVIHENTNIKNRTSNK